ncbi:hypothetical protein P7K49_013763 [Saguinus oedipus]|uniref:Uncharacterized protein n=1 Tax=Saguinus oedipus TaxID=9490 RepID=A0ABQ9VGY2_SAGOE|nr:hypothetical protein P7K49_013763 [Saguinus oedipus]
MQAGSVEDLPYVSHSRDHLLNRWTNILDTVLKSIFEDEEMTPFFVQVINLEALRYTICIQLRKFKKLWFLVRVEVLTKLPREVGLYFFMLYHYGLIHWVKVQPRVKISKTNLQAIGVKGSVYQARDGNSKTGISKEADAESRKHIEKDKSDELPHQFCLPLSPGPDPECVFHVGYLSYVDSLLHPIQFYASSLPPGSSEPCADCQGTATRQRYIIHGRPTGGSTDRIQKLRKEYYQARREGFPLYEDDEGRTRPSDYDLLWDPPLLGRATKTPQPRRLHLYNGVSNTNPKCTVLIGNLKPSGFSLFGQKQPETMDQNEQLFIGFIIDVRIKQNDT